MLAFIPSSISTFTPATKPSTNFQYHGDISPLGYFDPLQFNTGPNRKEEEIKFWREAELQHGRTAMAGAVALPIIEATNSDMLAINYLSNMELMSQSPFWAGMAVFECLRMGVGWENPFSEKDNYFRLKKEYQPGNVISRDPDKVSLDRYNRELSNGRLAMLACAHIIGSELVTGQGIF